MFRNAFATNASRPLPGAMALCIVAERHEHVLGLAWGQARHDRYEGDAKLPGKASPY